MQLYLWLSVACVSGWWSTLVRHSTHIAKNERSKSTPPTCHPRLDQVTYLCLISHLLTSPVPALNSRSGSPPRLSENLLNVRELTKCWGEILPKKTVHCLLLKFGATSVFNRLLQALYYPFQTIFCLLNHLKHFFSDIYRQLVTQTKRFGCKWLAQHAEKCQGILQCLESGHPACFCTEYMLPCPETFVAMHIFKLSSKTNICARNIHYITWSIWHTDECFVKTFANVAVFSLYPTV